MNSKETFTNLIKCMKNQDEIFDVVWNFGIDISQIGNGIGDKFIHNQLIVDQLIECSLGFKRLDDGIYDSFGNIWDEYLLYEMLHPYKSQNFPIGYWNKIYVLFAEKRIEKSYDEDLQAIFNMMDEYIAKFKENDNESN